MRRTRLTLSDSASLAPDDAIVRAVAGDGQADRALPSMRQAASTPECFTPVRAESGKGAATAVSLPGAAGRAFGTCSLIEVDFELPIARGQSLSLSKHNQSFSRPAGGLGVAWTLDLPRLDRHVRRVRQQGDRTETVGVYLLCSPLISVCARLDRRAFVPEANGGLLVCEGAPETLGLANDRELKTGAETTVVILRDGSRWHFDQEGTFALAIRARQMNRALPVDESAHLRDRMFRRDRDQHMHMVRQQAPPPQSGSPPARQGSEDLAQVLPRFPVDRLPTGLRDKHDVNTT
jgi:hypothetical protein